MKITKKAVKEMEQLISSYWFLCSDMRIGVHCIFKDKNLTSEQKIDKTRKYLSRATEINRQLRKKERKEYNFFSLRKEFGII